MKILKLVIPFFVFLLYGCGGGSSNNHDDEFTSIDEFIPELNAIAGKDSINCGDVYDDYSDERDDELIETARNCALDSYLYYRPFFVSFRQDGLHAADYIGYAYDGINLFTGSFYFDLHPQNGVYYGTISIHKCVLVNIVEYGFPLQCILPE